MTEVTVRHGLNPTEFTIWRSLDSWLYQFTENLRPVTQDILDGTVPADRYGDDEDKSICLGSIESMVEGWFIDGETGEMHPNCGDTEPAGAMLYVYPDSEREPDGVTSVTEMKPSPTLYDAAVSMNRILNHWDDWAARIVAARNGNA